MKRLRQAPRSECISPASYAWMLAIATFAVALTGAFTLRAQVPETKISPAPGGPAQVLELRIGDEIEPVMAEYVDGGIEEAARTHASLILITMDTPGGLSTSMEDIIHHILDSPVPVAIFVSPAGSRGASAGFFILLSADIAAMAPGTHTGAASPLLAIGGVPLQVDETLKKKILNDATAFLRSYTAKRGRNVELAETAVVDGKAWTETEALDGKLIDLIANSPEDLLAKLDGRTIKRFDGSTVQLALRNPQRVAVLHVVPPAISFADRAARRVFHSADRGSAGALHRIHASGNGRAGSDRRDCAGAGAVRDAHSAGGSRGHRFDFAGAGVIYSGGEVHQPRRAGDWRHRGHAAGRADAGAFAADACGREPGRGVWRDAAVCAAHDFPDAAGAALALVEAVDGARATGGLAGEK